MPIFVNDGGTNKNANEVHVNDSGTWKRANEVYVKTGGAWELAFGVTYVSLSNASLSGVNMGYIKNFNLGTYLGLSSPTIIVVTVTSGTNFVSTSNTTPAFDVGTLPTGTSVEISLPSDASITGRGGNGGYGSNSEGNQSMAGDFGGTGLYTRFPIALTNNGIIGGGGGGGGGAGGRRVYNAAGNGGGGAGGYHESIDSNQIVASDGTTGLSPGTNVTVPAGYGGIGAGPRTDGSTSPRASDGTKTNGGLGSDDALNIGNRIGGTGGNLGVAGLAVVAAGGAAGNAIDGNSYITFVTSGTISGGQVN